MSGDYTCDSKHKKNVEYVLRDYSIFQLSGKYMDTIKKAINRHVKYQRTVFVDMQKDVGLLCSKNKQPHFIIESAIGKYNVIMLQSLKSRKISGNKIMQIFNSESNDKMPIKM